MRRVGKDHGPRICELMKNFIYHYEKNALLYVGWLAVNLKVQHRKEGNVSRKKKHKKQKRKPDVEAQAELGEPRGMVSRKPREKRLEKKGVDGKQDTGFGNYQIPFIQRHIFFHI